MLLFCQKVYDRKLSGNDRDYTGPEWYATLAAATSLFCSLRTTQGGGAFPQVSVDLEHSNDSVNWVSKTQLYNKQDVPSDGIAIYYAEDVAGDTTGAFVRLAVYFQAADHSGHIALHVSGRGKPPARRPPRRSR